MEVNFHIVDSLWRSADAAAYEARVKAINDWLEHTDDLVRMFEDDEKITSQLRSIAGAMRAKRNDFETAGEKLRAELNDREGK